MITLEYCQKLMRLPKETGSLLANVSYKRRTDPKDNEYQGIAEHHLPVNILDSMDITYQG